VQTRGVSEVSEKIQSSADSADSQGAHDFWENLKCACRVLSCLDKSDFWEWKGGSVLFFWRWGPVLREARDGFPIRDPGSLAKYKRRQRRLEPDIARKLAEKIHDQRVKGYIEQLETSAGEPDQPISDVDYFPVPKTECPVTGKRLDIRVVYNGTSSGLNEAVWAPNFWLPTPNTALRHLDYGLFMCGF